ncbi:MAG: hypothetical protein H7Y30_03190 [Pyrinomonadaceae bacterium]|nr:hypothetical protein [Pyrinomonadaceae bacterium]
MLVQVPAQQRPPSAKDAERARRAKAIELIAETADTARGFKDLFYRARVQTLAADALWPHDEERARMIFRRAWEAATAFDKAEQEAEERESGVPSTLPITEARDEVLAKAASRDAKLADTFLRELLNEKKEDEKAAEQAQQPTQRRTPWREVSAAGMRRLALAYELLNRDEPARAAEIVAPVTNEGVSGDLITFILRLRERSFADADALYARLLERARSDALADANDALLLSAPIISPQLLVVVDNQGALQFRPVPRATTNALPPIAPPVRNIFYSIAANILQRPIVPRAGASTTPEAVALYFAIGRLLPFFEREAVQYVPGLRLRNATLANEIEAGRRERLDSQSGLNSLTPTRPGDPLRSQVDQLGRARDAADRDRIALSIVRKAAGLKLWDRARRSALEIENLGLRRAALSFLAVNQIADLLRAFAEDKEANFESMAKFVRGADAPPQALAWGLAQAATIAARKEDKESAAALLDEAAAFAARTPAGTEQRVAAYIAVARLAAGIDAKRAWELLPEVVRAAGAAEDYAGDDVSIEIVLDESHAEMALEPLSISADVFRLDGFFATMAHLDSEKALAAARSIGKDLPQSFAMLAVARAMLNTGLRTQNSGHRRKNDFAFIPSSES